MAVEPGLYTEVVTDNTEFDRRMQRSKKIADQMGYGLESLGKIGQRAAQQLRPFEDELDKTSRAARGAASGLAILENQYLDVGDASSRSARRVTLLTRAHRLMRGQLYNTSIQLQDFAVQVAAGTSAVTAFSQNAPQFLSVLGPQFAALGAAFAALPFLLVDFSKEAEDTFSALEEALNGYQRALEDTKLSTEDLTERFGVFAEEAKILIKDLAAIKSVKAEEAIDAIATSIAGIDLRQLNEIVNIAPGISAELEQIPSYISAQIRDWLELNQGIRKNQETVANFVAAMMAVEAAEGPKAQLLAVQELSDLLVSLVGDYSTMNESQRAFFDRLKQTALLLAELGKFTPESEDQRRAIELEKLRVDYIKLYYDNLEAAAKLEKDMADGTAAIISARDEEVARLQQELIMNQTILKYGKDSAEVALLKASNERKAYEEQLKQQGVLGNNLTTAMLLYDQNVKVKDEVAEAAERAKEFAAALKEASAAMASLDNFSAGLDRALAVSVARVQALKTGADAAIAGQIAGMRADLDRRMNAAVAAGLDRGVVEREFGGERERISQLEASEEERKRLEEANRGGGGANPLMTQIEQLRESLLTQEQLELESYQRRRQLLEDFLLARPEQLEKYNSMMEALEQQHADRMMQIDAYRYGDTLAKTGAFLGDMAEIMANGNEKMLRISKAFGAAQALISTYQGAAKELEKGVFGFATAAALIAKGLGFVSAIQGVNKGGTTSGGGAGGVAAPAAAQPAPVSRNVAISLTGGDMFSRDQVRNLINSINEAVEDGAIVRLV